ncbi:efflux RND transporter periplasmic adaptor subunit [Pseudaestuariivita atlantica]|uniref:Hemolysin D n=1 Tax=Pseudaestuariivita atlantica TaxID=1317121 RepID=A0A0L1JLJ3_9RHOB|nr:HlyD family efflux transporter periplasmic adaptor subunit [Pseudaestuariivita atlantica]KNG92587.1 hemolysin D [Pseudaestuariivita atlantica]
MRFLRHSLTGLFLVSLTLGLLVWAGTMVSGALQERMAREGRAAEPRERVFAVNVTTATPQTITPELQTFGEVQARRTLDVRAAAGGTVVALSDNFVEGGQVAAGEVLVQIDPKDAELALERVAADLSDAEAEVREAERALALARDELGAAEEQEELRAKALDRQNQLTTRGVGTAANQEAAELALSTARQSVLTRRQALAQAEARVNQAATRLARTRIAEAEAQRRIDDLQIRARFDGTLTGVSLVEGGLVSANTLLGQLIDAGALEVAFRVSTAQYARLLDDAGRLGSAPVRVTLDVFGTDLEATGTLSRDSAAVGEGQTGRQVFARLDAAPGFKPGDFVTVVVDEPELDRVVRLPASALNAADEVLVLGDDSRLEAMPVTLLRRQGDDVLVRAPELAGRQAVNERTPVLGAGIRVRAIERGADGEAPAVPDAPAMVELTEERRAKLLAFVEGNQRMPAEVKERILGQLAQPQVPARVVERLESRMGS